MATEIWVNIGSGNGLLPDGTKPLPEPKLTDHQWSPVTFILGQDMPQPSITKICFKITCLKFHSNFPGANELKFYWSTLLTNIVFSTSQAFPVDAIFVKIEVIHFGPSDMGLVTSQRGTPNKKPLRARGLPSNPAPDGGPIWKIT